MQTETLDVETGLVARLKAGEEKAFEEMVLSYGGRLLAVARRGLRQTPPRQPAALHLLPLASARGDCRVTEREPMLVSRITRLYDAVTTKLFDRLRDPLLLVLRGWWGWSFFVAGKNKLANIEGIVDYFGTLGIPFPGPNAYFVSSLEVVGGLLLLAGLFARPVAFLLTVNMTVAYLTADRAKVLNILSEPEKFIAADPFLFLVVSALVLAFGPGKLSLDTLLRRFVNRRLDPRRAAESHFA